MSMRVRRLAAVILAGGALLLTGCSADQLMQKVPFVQKQIDLMGELGAVFGPTDLQVSLADGGVLAFSPEQDGSRQVGYLVTVGPRLRLVGEKQAVRVTGPLTVRQEQGLIVIEYLKEKAPQYLAFTLTEGGLAPADYYTAVAPVPTVRTGHHLVVNKHLNVLWHYQDGKLIRAYRVATGRDTTGPQPTWTDFATNFVTPEGSFVLSNLAVNPSYTALKPGDRNYGGGEPGNPLGTRWMGFEVLKGDGGGVWAIHGTAEPDRIGTWASDGCIRMYTEEAEQLFTIVKGKSATLLVVAR